MAGRFVRVSKAFKARKPTLEVLLFRLWLGAQNSSLNSWPAFRAPVHGQTWGPESNIEVHGQTWGPESIQEYQTLIAAAAATAGWLAGWLAGCCFWHFYRKCLISRIDFRSSFHWFCSPKRCESQSWKLPVFQNIAKIIDFPCVFHGFLAFCMKKQRKTSVFAFSLKTLNIQDWLSQQFLWVLQPQALRKSILEITSFPKYCENHWFPLCVFNVFLCFVWKIKGKTRFFAFIQTKCLIFGIDFRSSFVGFAATSAAKVNPGNYKFSNILRNSLIFLVFFKVFLRFAQKSKGKPVF